MSLVPQCSAAGRFERAREGFLYRRVYSTLNYCIRNNSECESEPAFLLRCRPVTTTVAAAAAAAAAAAPGSCSSPVDVFFPAYFFFLGREKDQNREAHAESNRVEEEGGFKEERRLKGKGEEKEEEKEVIALGSVCSSSIPQLLSSALCALALSLVPPPIRDSPLLPRLQKGASSPSSAKHARFSQNAEAAAKEGQSFTCKNARWRRREWSLYVGEAAVAKIRVQRTLLPSAPSISIRSSPFLSPVAKQGGRVAAAREERAFQAGLCKKDPPLSSPHALVS